MPKTDDELKQIAIDFCEGKIFTSAHLNNLQNIGMVFMPLLLGAAQQMTEEERNNIGLIYEYYSEAGPRSINGYPIFFSFRILTKEETDRTQAFIDEYTKMKEAFLPKKKQENEEV